MEFKPPQQAGAMPASAPRVPLESVITTEELARRPSRSPDYEAESRALSTLMEAMASATESAAATSVLQRLVETALVLCRADSAGVSLLEEEDGREIFRWRAAAGGLAKFLNDAMPRALSPSGTVLDRDAVVLMRHPERHFSYSHGVPPIAEVLLVPFHCEGKPTGTVWIIAHDQARQFDAEDRRLVTRLSQFAATAYQLLATQELREQLAAQRAVDERLAADLDQQRRTEAALRDAQERLRQADRRKDEFLAILAHELRNPLAPVRNAVQILRMSGQTSPELQWARDVIDRQIRQMSRLIDDLLDISRIARDRLELRREWIDLAKVVQAAVEISRPSMEERQQQLTVTLPSEPIVVDADPTRLAQAFANLLNNASKYSEPANPILLAAQREGSEVVVRVRDHGIGIAQDMLERVFDLFSQVDPSHERSLGGLGIGLTLAKRLVEMHGGTVSASSPGIGQGSEFVVRLSIITSPLIATPKAEEPLAKAAGRRRILVVDDHQDTAATLAKVLDQLGYDTQIASDSLAGLKAAAEIRPHAALLDIGMPEMSGYELARRIRAQPWGRDAVLIAVSGWGQAEDKQRTADAGFDHHLVKPVDPAELARLLATSTARRWQRVRRGS